MLRKLSRVLPISLLLVPCCLWAGEADYVKQVYICGNDIGIQMQNTGWVYVNGALGEKQVDRIYSMALALLATGKKTGFFNDGAAVSWCGTTAKPITVLSISSNN